MRSGVLLLNGEFSEVEFVRPFLGDEFLCVAVDGGARHAALLRVTPQILLGDMDSISAELLSKFKTTGTEILCHPVEKDYTDLELGLRLLSEKGFEEVHLIGLEGGRIDHVMATHAIFGHEDFWGIRLWGYEKRSRFTSVRAGEKLAVKIDVGERFSLIPITEKVSGVTLSGAKWNLSGADLRLGESRGLSNIAKADQLSVSVRSGALILVLG